MITVHSAVLGGNGQQWIIVHSAVLGENRQEWIIVHSAVLDGNGQQWIIVPSAVKEYGMQLAAVNDKIRCMRDVHVFTQAQEK